MSAPIAYHEARARALRRELDANPSLLVLGGSVSLPFNPGDGLLASHPEQVMLPPISEFATAAAGVGAAIAGLRTLVPISTASFMFYGWAPIVNEASNVRYLSGGAAWKAASTPAGVPGAITRRPGTFWSIACVVCSCWAPPPRREPAITWNATGALAAPPER